LTVSGKKSWPGFGRLGRNDGGENDGFAVGGEHGAVSLAGDLAGFELERAACPLDFDVPHASLRFAGSGGYAPKEIRRASLKERPPKKP
jgi:hypothetical protein